MISNNGGAFRSDLPCPHCGHTPKNGEDNWCYSLKGDNGRSYSVCKRGAEPAPGWEKTPWLDKNGTPKYQLIEEKQEKSFRPKKERHWDYKDKDGNDLIRVYRRDDGLGNRTFSQSHWNGKEWIKGYGHIKSEDIPIYNYALVQYAIQSNLQIWIVEGESCCDALWEKFNFIATTNINGSGKWKEHHSKCLEGAKNIILCPDRDIPGIKHMETIAKDFPDAKWCYCFPDSGIWNALPDKQGLDVADWIEEGATKKLILSSITSIKEINSCQTQAYTRQSKNNDDNQIDKKERIEFIEKSYKYRLRLNIITNRVELDGKEYESNHAWIQILRDLEIELERTKAKDLFIAIAQLNEYCPIENYLEQIHKTILPCQINDLATRYLGTNNPLYDVYLKKTLIGAVARIYQPGCKVDTALILNGKQGIGKSTFFKVLGGQYYSDCLGGDNSRDNLMLLHSFWIHEWSEFDKITRKKEVEDVKAFLACPVDTFKPMYSTSTTSYPRRCVIVGSVNADQFLQDPTGHRRFWVIPCSEKVIDTKLLSNERDAIWSASVAAYLSGEQWYLTEEEQGLSATENANYEISDVWEDVIGHFLNTSILTSVKDAAFNSGLKLEAKELNRANQMRIANILKRLGWKKIGMRELNCERQQCWGKDV
jgi:predicted P-loop ATPase